MTMTESMTSTTIRTELDDRAVMRPVRDAEEDDPDYTSSSGSSSSEEDEEEDEEEDNEVGEKASDEQHQFPRAQSGLRDVDTNSALRSRLAAFLPELERSNRELETADEVRARRVDEVDDDAEHYVEMNLSMGVLSEQSPKDDVLKTRDNGSEEDTSDDDNNSDEQRENDTKMTLRTKVNGKSKVEELV